MPKYIARVLSPGLSRKYTYYYRTRSVGIGSDLPDSPWMKGSAVKLRTFGREGGRRTSAFQVVGSGRGKQVTVQHSRGSRILTQRTYSRISPASVLRFRRVSSALAKAARGQGNWVSG